MSKKSTIWINTADLYTSNTNYNVYRYYFPTPYQFKRGSQVGLQAINIFNSTYNISASIGNNTFSIVWPANFTDGSTSKTYSFTIPDGYYAESDLNYYLQQCMISNNLYLTQTSTGSNVYFLEIVANSVKYAVEINTYVLPNSSTFSSSGYSYPTGATWTVSSSSLTPQLTICSGLQTWTGITTQSTFPSTTSTTTNQQFISNTYPVVNPVNAYVLTCNMVNSNFTIPSNLFYQIPLISSWGELISLNYGGSQINYLDIVPAQYSYIEIVLLNQNYTNLQFVDKEILIILSILEN